MRYDGYIRVSSRGGRSDERFLSPEIQRDTITRLADANGVELGEVVQEIDVSGSKRIDDRELGRLVEKVENGESGGVIVWRLSRFSRSLLDAVETATRITRAGGQLIAEDFDSANSMSKALLGLLAGLAEEELDARRKGWDEAHRRAVERGVGMTVPIGYRKGQDGRLRIHKAEARLVRLAFRLRADGVSIAEIARRIGRSHATVHELLQNVVYLGTVKWGPYVKEHAHPALVDRVLFDAANAARTTRAMPPGELTRDRLLQGVARCSGCGHTLKVVHRNSRGERVPSYYCKNQAKEPCHERAFVPAEALDDYIEAWFTNALMNDSRMVDVVSTGRELEQAQQEQAAAEGEFRAFVENASALDRAMFQRGLDARQRRIDEAHELVRSLAGRMSRLPAGGALPSLWRDLQPAERRDVLAGYLDRVIVAKGATRDLLGSIQIVWADGTVADDEAAVRVAAA